MFHPEFSPEGATGETNVIDELWVKFWAEDYFREIIFNFVVFGVSDGSAFPTPMSRREATTGFSLGIYSEVRNPTHNSREATTGTSIARR